MPTTPVTILFITVMLDLLGFGMVLPLMPLYAADPRFAASPTEIGWLMAIFSLMQFLFAPLWGALSDRIGRRPVLLLGLYGSALSYLIYAMGENYATLFSARALAGFMGANIAAAQAAMADLTPPHKRAHGMGLIGAAFSIGFILGPALGGILSAHGMETAPLAAAFITGLNALAASFLLPETRQINHASPPAHRPHPFSATLWRAAIKEHAALLVCLTMGLFITLFAAFEVSLPLWGAHFHQWSISSIGWVFMLVGTVSALVQGGLVRKIAPRLGERRMAQLGLLLVAVGIALLTLPDPLFWAGLVTVAAGAGLTHPGLSSLASLNASPDHQGSMMGLFHSLAALGRVLGPLMGGALFALFPATLYLFIPLGLLLLLTAFLRFRNHLMDAPRKDASDSPASSPTVP